MFSSTAAVVKHGRALGPLCIQPLLCCEPRARFVLGRLRSIVAGAFCTRFDMSEIIINTVQYRFPAGSPPPSWEETAHFLKQLDTDLSLMEAAYKTAQNRTLYIKFTTSEAMTESLQKNVEPRQFVYANGKSVAVKMSIAGANMQYVRVFDLPPELSDDSLSLTLGKFGEINHVTREKFPAESGLGHMYTGVRGVYMDVQRSIPPSIDVGERKARIFYEGLKDTCFLCGGLGHRRESCPQRQNRKQRANQGQGNSVACSYADVVSGQGSTLETPKIAEVEEEEVIEVLEEDDEEYIDVPTEVSEAEQVENVRKAATDAEKEAKRKESLEQLEQVARAIHDAMLNPQANQRRAQYASSASGSSSGSGPRMKVARKSRY